MNPFLFSALLLSSLPKVWYHSDPSNKWPRKCIIILAKDLFEILLYPFGLHLLSSVREREKDFLVLFLRVSLRHSWQICGQSINFPVLSLAL